MSSLDVGSDVTWGTESGGYIPLTVEGVSKSVALSTHNHSGVYEPVLGNPTSNSYLLSSTTTGTRSWVKPYSLPTASALTLGGVKIGTNVSISNGTISVHNPLTLGTANGLSLSTQQLSLALANTTNNGALSATDKVYINLLREFFEHDTANNAIKALKPFYSVGEVSAYGLGSGGSSGGGGISMMQGWTIPAGTGNYYAPANLVVPFYNDMQTRVANLEGAGGTTPTQHTHVIGDITGLQSALDGKVDDSQVLTNVPANAKFTDTIYTHPSHTARTSGLYKITVNSLGHVTSATTVAKSDITALGIPAQDTVYTHPSSHSASMIAAGTFTGIVKAQNNTSYTTKQVRNIILSTGNAVASQMANGDI